MTALAKSNEPSMEDILASIRRIIADDQQATIAPKEAAAPPPGIPSDEDVLDLAFEAVSAEPEPETDSQDDVDLLFAEPEPELVPPPLPPVPVAAPAEPVIAAPPPVPAPPVPVVTSDLLSEASTASVSGAFASLSNTLLTGNARTLEDLVKDMMKPMLKTWLDDNLPSIVERLVKAEIERVARSGR